MTSENILKSIKTKGGIGFFHGNYNPSTDPKYKLILENTFNISDKIETISTYQDIIVIGSPSTQTVYILKRSGVSLNVIKKITPSSSNLINCSKFGSNVKITDIGIFITDPEYASKGAVFLFYITNIGSNIWLDNPVQITPTNYTNKNDGMLFGYDIDATNNILLVSALSEQNNTTSGAIYYFSINYNTKYISQVNRIENPSNISKKFGSNVLLYNQVYSIISCPDETIYNNGVEKADAGCVYICDNTNKNILNNIYNVDDTNELYFGTSISSYMPYAIISETGSTEGNIYVYKVTGTIWTLLTETNITALSLGIYTSGTECSSVFIYNKIILWNLTGSNNVYVSEITEAETIVPSSNNVLTKDNYEYGILFSAISDYILIVGYNGSNTSIDLYQTSSI